MVGRIRGRQPKISIRREPVTTGRGLEQRFTVRLNAGSSVIEFGTKKEAISFGRRLRRRSF